MDEVDENGLDNVEPPRKGFLTDPMTFAHLLPPRPVMMINSRWDELIPREAAIDFWERAGKPYLFFYPAIHSTLWFWYPFIVKRVTDFIGSLFPDKKP